METTEKTTKESASSTVKKPDAEVLRPVSIWKSLGVMWSSRKLWSTIFCVTILWLVQERAIMLLYTFTEPAQISAFQAITLTTLAAIAAVVTAFVGVQGFAKSTLTTVLNASSSVVNEKREEHIVSERTERIIQEGDPGAPERRPFNPNERHEDEA